LVSDGFPQDWLDQADVRHIRLGRSHRDYGNTPRGIGALLAVSEGYEGIGRLDAANWYESFHVEECCRAAAKERHPDLVVARRRLRLADGTATNLAEEPAHGDTSCYWFLEGSFHLLHYWAIMPTNIAPVCDRLFYRIIKA